ncbi:hypothetical protein OROMI_006608 [Orobanche minor]
MWEMIPTDWRLKSFTLGYFSTLDGNAENYPVNIVMKLLSNWEVEDKVSTITSQTESIDLDESAIKIKDKLQHKLLSFPVDGRFFHVSCCADKLSAIAVRAFSRVESAISAVRAYSSWRKAPLYWDNTLGMLQEAQELEAEGRYEEDDPPTAEEWEQVRVVCKLVQKVYDVAEVLFETNYASGGFFFHNLQELIASLMDESKSSDEFTKKIAGGMLMKLDNYWEKDSLILSIVTALDPRYKMKYFEFSSLKYGAASGILDIKTISDSIHKLYDDYASCITGKEYTTMMSGSDSGCEEDFIRAEVRDRCSHPAFGFKCLDEYQQFVQSWPSKSELDFYLEEEPIVPWSNKFCVVSRWKDASPKYPTISKMARDLLPIRFSLVAGSEAYYSMYVSLIRT